MMTYCQLLVCSCPMWRPLASPGFRRSQHVLYSVLASHPYKAPPMTLFPCPSAPTPPHQAGAGPGGARRPEALLLCSFNLMPPNLLPPVFLPPFPSRCWTRWSATAWTSGAGSRLWGRRPPSTACTPRRPTPPPSAASARCGWGVVGGLLCEDRRIQRAAGFRGPGALRSSQFQDGS